MKWGSAHSPMTQLFSGIRPGGILSPFLFSIYVDSVLKSLIHSELGCYIKGICCNSLMYADYLLLITISLDHLQRLVDICSSEFDSIGMIINADKTACIRIGPRHANKVVSITVNAKQVDWKSEFKHLVVYVTSGSRFNCNLQIPRQKSRSRFSGLLK